MKSKRIIAFMAVAIMLLCPFAVACAETEGDSNAIMPSYFSKVEGKSYESVSQTIKIPTSNEVASLIGFDFTIRNEDSVFDAQIDITNLKVVSGLTAKQENLNLDGRQIWNVSYDFVMTITANADNVKLKVNEKNYYSGEGYDLLKSYLGKTFAKGDKMVFKGKLDIKTAGKNIIDFYKRDDGNYIYKNIDMEALLNEKIEYNVTFKDDSKGLSVVDSVKSDITMYGECDYKDYQKTKHADPYKYKNQKIDIKTYETSTTVKENGSDKKVNINTDKIKENMKKSMEGGTAVIFTQAEYDEMTSIKNLPHLTETYQKKSASEIENSLKGLGFYSTEKSDFDNEYNAIENSVSSGSDKTWILVAISIVIAVLSAVAIALQFFDFKKPKA